MTKRAVFTTLLALVLACAIFAELPAPVIRYTPTPPRMELIFYTTEPFPPAGFAFWAVDIEKDGIGATYTDANPSRTVRLALAEPLEPGTYYIQARIYDDDGVVLDEAPRTEWTYAGPVYGGDLPRVVVGGPEGWDTGVAMSSNGSETGALVEWELYDEDGKIAASGGLTIPPHGCPSFNFSAVVAPPEGGTFVGSARLRATTPVTVVYLCDSKTTRGFSLIQVLHEIN